jgi:hypothetical protein
VLALFSRAAIHSTEVPLLGTRLATRTLAESPPHHVGGVVVSSYPILGVKRSCLFINEPAFPWWQDRLWLRGQGEGLIRGHVKIK